MLVLNAAEVGQLVRSVNAHDLVTMMAKTLHALSSVAHETSSGTPAIQSPMRISTSTDDVNMLYMPSRLTTAKGVSITAAKIVGVPKPTSSSAKGLPGTTLLFDESTGACKAVVCSSELTGVRTAAASALSVHLVASDNVQNVVVFGSGVQAYWHARLVLQIRPAIESLTIVCRQLNQRAKDLATTLKNEFDSVEIKIATLAQSKPHLKEADIICSCVPSSEPLFHTNDLRVSGKVHIAANTQTSYAPFIESLSLIERTVGSHKPTMFEFPPDLIGPDGAIQRVMVDSRDACLKEAGEIISSGIAAEHLVEIGSLVDGEGQAIKGIAAMFGRDAEKSLYKSVGVGVMDVAVTALVYEMAERLGIGQRLEFG